MPNDTEPKTDQTEAEAPAGGGFAGPPCSLDYFSVNCSFRLHQGREDYRHICNVKARDEKHALKIARESGLSVKERGRKMFATRIGRDGYARALARAGFTVTPHPDDLAARRAISARPTPALSKIEDQIEKADAFHSANEKVTG